MKSEITIVTVDGDNSITTSIIDSETHVNTTTEAMTPEMVSMEVQVPPTQTPSQYYYTRITSNCL